MWRLAREIQLKFYAYLNYIICFITGFVRDQIDLYTGKNIRNQEKGYIPSLNDFHDFFFRRFFNRLSDCFSRVVTSNPGTYFDLKVPKMTDDLEQKLYFEKETKHVMNFGSINYLGFGDQNDFCTSSVIEALKQYGPATCSPSSDLGTTVYHQELEKTLANFLGTEDAICYGMGWLVNVTAIPALIGKGDLIILDAFSHNSITTGAKASGAVIRIFRHNDMSHLERVLRREIINGQPRTHRQWAHIIVAVEAIYSRDGDIVRLAELVQLRRKYRFSIWLDEAHSIGSLGSSGRGVCEHCGVNPKEIDFLMGSFAKSFGATGGYIAANKNIISYLRFNSYAKVYSDSMPAPIAQQVISAIKFISENPEGQKRLKSLHENSVWFRHELIKRDFNVTGEDGSPIVSIVIPPFSLLSTVSRECLKNNLAVAILSLPQVDILEGRIRFCLNSQHTRAELLNAINTIDQICKDLPVKVH